MPDLRLLLIDATPIDGPAATSALKRVYMGGWRRSALVHLHTVGKMGALAVAIPGEVGRPIKPGGDVVGALIDGFEPQVVLYRPVADHPALHRCAMDVLRHTRAPLVLWLMDDWPMRLKETDPKRFADMDRDLRWLFERSSLNWAISEPMADAYAKRYGATFDVLRNGVAANDWPLRPKSKETGTVVVRYAGSLAPDTARDAVFATAQTISALAAEGAPVKLEIRTQQTWLEAFGADYAGYPHVEVSCSSMTDKEYRRWLSAADILLMAYNFDEDTKRYLQYSFANKTPETLASGAAVLAYGPRGLATIDYLAGAEDIAEVVTEPGPSQLKKAVKRLASDGALRRRLGENARAHAFSNFDVQKARKRFRDGLKEVMASAPVMPEATVVQGADAVFDAISEKKSAYRNLADMFIERFPQVAQPLRRFVSRLRRRA